MNMPDRCDSCREEITGEYKPGAFGTKFCRKCCEQTPPNIIDKVLDDNPNVAHEIIFHRN
jgi:hypothetical protein